MGGVAQGRVWEGRVSRIPNKLSAVEALVLLFPWVLDSVQSWSISK